jgi:hypothetical protein
VTHVVEFSSSAKGLGLFPSSRSDDTACVD